MAEVETRSEIMVGHHNHTFSPLMVKTSKSIKSEKLMEVAEKLKKRKKEKGSKASTWSEEEDQLLREAITLHDGKNWKKIAECLQNRSDTQCLHRWQKVLNPVLVKGAWTKEEDDVLCNLVQEQGPKNWSSIAGHLKGRIGKQCRERWYNHLDPQIRKDPWTLEEDRVIIESHLTLGNRWAAIAKLLEGRPSNAIKNHWNSTLKRKVVESGLVCKEPKEPKLPPNRVKIEAIPTKQPKKMTKKRKSPSDCELTNQPTQKVKHSPSHPLKTKEILQSPIKDCFVKKQAGNISPTINSPPYSFSIASGSITPFSPGNDLSTMSQQQLYSDLFGEHFSFSHEDHDLVFAPNDLFGETQDLKSDTSNTSEEMESYDAQEFVPFDATIGDSALLGDTVIDFDPTSAPIMDPVMDYTSTTNSYIVAEECIQFQCSDSLGALDLNIPPKMEFSC